MERDSARAEKETRACALTVFSHLSKLSHGNLRFPSYYVSQRNPKLGQFTSVVRLAL